MQERKPRGTLPRRSETRNSLNKIVWLVDKIRPLYPQAFEIASSKPVRGGAKVSGGDKSDPTGETASCSCEGAYHSCPPAQLRRAAQAISDAEGLINQALVKINSIFKASEQVPKEEIFKDPPGKWARSENDDGKPTVTPEELQGLKSLQKEREAGSRGVA